VANVLRLDVLKFSDEAARLREFLESRIVGQELAKERILRRYEEFCSPLRRPNKPIGAFIFLGPSGVGKTKAAKTLAEFFCGGEDALTRVHCPNYQNGHEISTLIGAPPSYVGYDDPKDTRQGSPPMLAQRSIDRFSLAYLTDRLEREDREIITLRQKIERLYKELELLDNDNSKDLKIKDREIKALEFNITFTEFELKERIRHLINQKDIISVILFDEIEKAHSSLKNFILALTDDGRAPLANGQITDFTRSWVVMTSNAGSEEIARVVAGGKNIAEVLSLRDPQKRKSDEIYHEAMRALRLAFNPEFLGRVEQDIIVFHPLSQDQRAKVLQMCLKDLWNFLAGSFPIELVVGDDVFAYVLEKGSDHPEYNARLIEDKLDKYIKEPLAILMNTGQVKMGDKVIVKLIKQNGNRQIIFEKE